MKYIILFCLLFIQLNVAAVEPPVGGVFDMVWTKALTNPIVDWNVWESTNGGTKWKQIGETRTNYFKWTNLNINVALTRYAVTEMAWSPSGSQDTRVMTEMTLLHWAPTGSPATNASNYVQLKSAIVPVPFTIRVSPDLSKFNDWLRFSVFDGTNELTNVTARLDHATSTERPKLFFDRPVIPFVSPFKVAMPPMPSSAVKK